MTPEDLSFWRGSTQNITDTTKFLELVKEGVIRLSTKELSELWLNLRQDYAYGSQACNHLLFQAWVQDKAMVQALSFSTKQELFCAIFGRGVSYAENKRDPHRPLIDSFTSIGAVSDFSPEQAKEAKTFLSILSPEDRQALLAAPNAKHGNHPLQRFASLDTKEALDAWKSWGGELPLDRPWVLAKPSLETFKWLAQEGLDWSLVDPDSGLGFAAAMQRNKDRHAQLFKQFLSWERARNTTDSTPRPKDWNGFLTQALKCRTKAQLDNLRIECNLGGKDLRVEAEKIWSSLLEQTSAWSSSTKMLEQIWDWSKGAGSISRQVFSAVATCEMNKGSPWVPKGSVKLMTEWFQEDPEGLNQLVWKRPDYFGKCQGLYLCLAGFYVENPDDFDGFFQYLKVHAHRSDMYESLLPRMIRGWTVPVSSKIQKDYQQNPLRPLLARIMSQRVMTSTPLSPSQWVIWQWVPHQLRPVLKTAYQESLLMTLGSQPTFMEEANILFKSIKEETQGWLAASADTSIKMQQDFDGFDRKIVQDLLDNAWSSKLKTVADNQNHLLHKLHALAIEQRFLDQWSNESTQTVRVVPKARF